MSAFGGKADMTVCGSPLSWSLLGVKRTCLFASHMSAFDPKRTSPASLRCQIKPLHCSVVQPGANMRRRDFITLIGGVTVGWPLAAHTQQLSLPVIGFLDPRTPEVVAARLRGFRQGLKESGYFEGENVAIVYRWAEDRIDRLPALALDLVRRPVAVIVASGPLSSFAAKAATTTIPIVFLVGNDPVQLGLTTSLSRPSSNMTGINIFNSELVAKRLELLRDLLPGATRIGVLANPADATLTEPQSKEVTDAGRTMGLQIQVHNANTSAEINAAFEAMGRERPDAVIVESTPFLNGRQVQLAQLSAFHRLPTISALRDYAEVGGLMSYGSNIVDSYRQAGLYVGRILKGAKPAELPVVQPNKFELVINAQTARMLGLTVSTSLLGRADEVID